jgi:hypothetical protein
MYSTGRDQRLAVTKIIEPLSQPINWMWWHAPVIPTTHMAQIQVPIQEKDKSKRIKCCRNVTDSMTDQQE